MRLVAFAAAALLSGCESSPQIVDPKIVPVLQKEASTACLCTRAKGFDRRDACWQDFQEQIARYRYSEVSSACAEGSSSYLEFEPTRADTMVTTQWPYGACSDDEVPAKQAEFERRTGQAGC